MSELGRRASEYFQDLQDKICEGLGRFEREPYREDEWSYADGGGGRSRVWTNGSFLEKGGVNFSNVSGRFSDDFAGALPGEGRDFTATGLSLVLHPTNPFVPTVHANFRFLTKGDAGWFGGGADLTPYYPFREDCISFHRTWRDVCDRHRPLADHQRFKQWCDEYFFIKHRNEPRGVGGIFFDYLSEDLESTFAFVKEAGDRFLDSYLPIVERRIDHPFTEANREFQRIRRGRYVEFNLVYDRGTVFGLKTGGRIESILMSLPLHCSWPYNYAPQPGSPEAELFEYLRPRDWAQEKLPGE